MVWNSVSASVLFHPCDRVIHPVLQKFPVVCTAVAAHIKQPLLCMDKMLLVDPALIHPRDVDENIAQMLWRHSRVHRIERYAGLIPCALGEGWLKKPADEDLNLIPVICRGVLYFTREFGSPH